MNEPSEVEERVEVPRNTGVPGFLRTLEGILKLPRVQNVVIDARGGITYKRVRYPDERASLQVNYELLQPSAIIRHADVVELPMEGEALEQVHAAFEQAALERAETVAWILGDGGSLVLKRWCPALSVCNDRLLGLPVFVDSGVSGNALILALAHTPRAYLVDCHRFYKIVMLPSAAEVREVV